MQEERAATAVAAEAKTLRRLLLQRNTVAEAKKTAAEIIHSIHSWRYMNNRDLYKKQTL